jgi:uncharacterized Zn-finger protein
MTRVFILFGFVLADIDVKEEWILRPRKPEVSSFLTATVVIKGVNELSSLELQKCLSVRVLINKDIDIGGIISKHHQQLKITKKQQHGYDICGAKFSRSSTLMRNKLIHSSQRLHGCDICGAKFSQRGHLRTHKLIHSGKKPHECDICGVRFIKIGNLNRHQLIHSGERPHGCDFFFLFFLNVVI